MSAADLAELLDRRMEAEQVPAGQPVTVAELHKRLVPYHVCRERLGLASKAEYDGRLLALLADERRIAVSDPALRAAVRAELEQAEPGVGFLHRFAATELVRLESEEAGAESEEVAAEPSPSSREDGAGCRMCGLSLPPVDGARYCPSCGADQQVPECPGCREEVSEDWRYCAFCGMLQAREPERR